MRGEIFDLLFNSAEITNFAPKERNDYIADMLTIRDRVNQLASAERRGMEKGMEKSALGMLRKGIPVSDICEITGLSETEVLALKEAESIQ